MRSRASQNPFDAIWILMFEHMGNFEGTTRIVAPGSRGLGRLFKRLLLETNGQDIVEYALLTTLIGFAGAAAWDLMLNGLGNAYGGFTDGVWNLWEPANPVGGGS